MTKVRRVLFVVIACVGVLLQGHAQPVAAPQLTDAEVVKFSNERIHPIADELAQLYFRAKAIQAEYQAAGLEKKFVDGEVLADGSATDGRHPILGQDVKAVMSLIDAYVVDFESGLNAKLNSVLKVAVNPQR